MAIILSKNEEQITNEVMSKISLSKDREHLGGAVVNLSKSIVNLSMKAGVDLGTVKAQVVVVMDYSGSMRKMYKSGTVQRVISKLLPLGLTFDDNGEVEVFRFENSYKQFPSLHIGNYSDYVEKILFDGKGMGGTEYAPVLNAIKKEYLAEKTKGLFGIFKKNSGNAEKSAKNPVFVIFITDGDNSDKPATDRIIRELSAMNCFVQFVGVGSAAMKYLEKLDDLSGRECDNTGFVRFANIENVSDSELYDNVLEQFADWLKVKGY